VIRVTAKISTVRLSFRLSKRAGDNMEKIEDGTFLTAAEIAVLGFAAGLLLLMLGYANSGELVWGAVCCVHAARTDRQSRWAEGGS
jgi:hypothetical protein